MMNTALSPSLQRLSDTNLLAELQRLPRILECLADSSLTLTTVGLLKAHLTEENHRDLLEAARHKSKRDVERMICGAQAVAGRSVVGAEVASAQSSRTLATRRSADADAGIR